jgi:hypothetical protein
MPTAMRKRVIPSVTSTDYTIPKDSLDPNDRELLVEGVTATARFAGGRVLEVQIQRQIPRGREAWLSISEKERERSLQSLPLENLQERDLDALVDALTAAIAAARRRGILRANAGVVR